MTIDTRQTVIAGGGSDDYLEARRVSGSSPPQPDTPARRIDG